MKRVWALGLAVALGGCAAYASRSDYAAYRRYRLASSEMDELRAMRDYLEAHPNGRFEPEIRADYEAFEGDYYEDARSTQAGLRAYLEVYPRGRFQEEAARRLAALSTVRSRRVNDDAERRTREQAERDAALAERRQWADRAVAYWSRVLLGVSNWDVPMEQVVADSADFDQAFVADPRPRCSATECVKFYALSYGITAVGQTRLERRIELALRLRLDEGRLVGAELLMPNRGFSRWYELENNTPVLDADPESRQATIEWALARIIPILRETVPTAAAVDVASEPIDALGVQPASLADSQAEEVEAEEVDVADEEGEMALVLPLVLQALEHENVRVVVFAAADEDEGDAFDGFQIRVIHEEVENAEGAAQPDEADG
ncbi:MAG: hypothetical protein AAF938_10645 [Myxococcota bacterium]